MGEVWVFSVLRPLKLTIIKSNYFWFPIFCCCGGGCLFCHLMLWSVIIYFFCFLEVEAFLLQSRRAGSSKAQCIATSDIQRYVWAALVPEYWIQASKLLYHSSYTEEAFSHMSVLQLTLQEAAVATASTRHAEGPLSHGAHSCSPSRGKQAIAG